ncbi:MAG: hypothetical protein WBN52_15315 [Eudoraea sp.]|uniref:hypothetical protein n=1 Tax=Eudoraea sp. TaxID=1979955 RepID=UPI003C78DE50
MKGGQQGFYKVSDRCVDWDTASQQTFDPLFQDEVRSWLKKLDLKRNTNNYQNYVPNGEL